LWFFISVHCLQQILFPFLVHSQLRKEVLALNSNLDTTVFVSGSSEPEEKRRVLAEIKENEN